MIIRCKKASASPVRNTLDSNNKSTVLPNRRNFKEEKRVEFFAIGKCIEQASVALDFSKHGEVYASSSIMNLFINEASSTILNENKDVCIEPPINDMPIRLAYRDEIFFAV